MSRQRPWRFGIYAGHSTPAESNKLFRRNLAKGQTRLSIAFDLPTQTGHDADHPLAAGEVGRVGVSVCSRADMERLFEDIVLAQVGTNMTINATAPWLLALYLVTAERRGVKADQLTGTTQNDIFKEYLSRGTFIFPPRPSLKLTTDLIEFAIRTIPNWNPVSICSYHLQEVGATPVQEVAFSVSNAIAILDDLQTKLEPDEFSLAFGRISFFCNSGIRFIEEACKMRAFARIWDRLGRERYRVSDPKLLRFRYGVQVNSLGLTESQPENNIARIAFETLGATLSSMVRTGYMQLPAWNEALGLPRPWDQQLSLRIQQILAFETDLLEYGDILDSSPVIESKVSEIDDAAWAEIKHIDDIGGAVAAIESGYMKHALVESHSKRMHEIQQVDRIVVGLNEFTNSEPSPLADESQAIIQTIDNEVERVQRAHLDEFRRSREPREHARSLERLRKAAIDGENIMEASLVCARAGVTTGEWGDALREIYTEYRAPTGLELPVAIESDNGMPELRERIREISARIGRNPKLLIGKPGLDGHSSGAEQIAVFARDAGFDVVYEGIRLTPEEIANAAQQEGVHIIGLSILSGSHCALVPEVLSRVANVPVVVGGVVPEDDAEKLQDMGVAAVYTPKDYKITEIIEDMVTIVANAHGASE